MHGTIAAKQMNAAPVCPTAFAPVCPALTSQYSPFHFGCPSPFVLGIPCRSVDLVDASPSFVSVAIEASWGPREQAGELPLAALLCPFAQSPSPAQVSGRPVVPQQADRQIFTCAAIATSESRRRCVSAHSPPSWTKIPITCVCERESVLSLRHARCVPVSLNACCCGECVSSARRLSF